MQGHVIDGWRYLDLFPVYSKKAPSEYTPLTSVLKCDVDSVLAQSRPATSTYNKSDNVLISLLDVGGMHEEKRILTEVIIWPSRETKCRRSDVRQMNDGTLVIRGSDHRLLRAKIRLSHTLEKDVYYRQRRRKEVVYDDCVLEGSLSQGDWHIEEDPNVDYEMLFRGLRACAERASKPRTTNLDRITKTTKELLERRALRLDPNASHIEQLVANTSCRKALQEDLLKYRQKKILEAAQRGTSLKKCRRDLREYNIPLAILLREDGTRTSSCREMKIITERFYSDFSRLSTPVSSPVIPTGEAPSRILPSEVRVTIKSMEPGTAPGPDFISADFLRAGGHPLHVILAAHTTSCLQKETIPD
ncbi:hypothetical protein RB195_022398 [Necator americanus]|uniref:Uncharacterized protein n=1 Tax=Necator americanus TaxID=51031 RepID=A0ABR1EFF9_NECAM